MQPNTKAHSITLELARNKYLTRVKLQQNEKGG